MVKPKTATSQPSTDEDVLGNWPRTHPLPKLLLLEHRGPAKLKNTYTDKLPLMVNPRTGRAHTSFSQATAVTGRLASPSPTCRTSRSVAKRAAASAASSRRGASHRLGRLFADRAAHHGPPVGRQGPWTPSPRASVHRATAAGEIFGTTRPRSPASSAATPR